MDRLSNNINDGKKVSGVFLDITKAFDTVDHKILLNKLYNYGVRGVVNNWFRSYLDDRLQCVKVNGVISEMGKIKYGVPQGSVLGATLFLVYINDLCDASLNGKITSFADDTALSYIGDSWDEVSAKINNDLLSIQWWFCKNNMVLSAEKTKFINFTLRGSHNLENKIILKCISCLSNGRVCYDHCVEVKSVSNIKYLGIIIDENINWKQHILILKQKITNTIRLFYFIRNMCGEQLLRSLYLSLVHSRLEYGIVCWGGTYVSNLKTISIVQKHFMRLITKSNRFESSFPLFFNLKILPLRYIYVYKVMKVFFARSRNNKENNDYRSRLRSNKNVFVPKPCNTFFTKSYNFLAPRIFNILPSSLKDINSTKIFLKKLRQWLFNIQNIEELLFQISV
jgi:hypothetical protein